MATHDVLHTGLLAMGNGALGLAGVALTQLARYLGARHRNQSVASTLNRVQQLADRVVKDVEARMVAPQKAAGQWDRRGADEARARAINCLRDYLGQRGMAELTAVLGDELAASRFLGAAIEAALLDAKVASAIHPTVFSTPTPGAQ